MLFASAFDSDSKLPSGIVATITTDFFKNQGPNIFGLFEEQMKELRLHDTSERMDAGLATIAVLIEN